MAIELGGIQFPRVHRIVTLEQAALVYHRIPGQAGNLVQNLGRDSVRLQIEGIFYGPQAQESLARLRDLYLKRTPVDFVADITSGAYAGRVTLDRLDVTQAADAPEQFSYVLIITEYVPPPKPGMNTMLIDQKVKLNAKQMLDLAILPDALLLGSTPELTNPIVPLQGALEPVRSASGGLLSAMDGMKKILGA